MSQPAITWKLREFLEREGVTVYALSKKLSERSDASLSMRTLYRWWHTAPSNPSLDGIAWLLWGVGQLKGREFEVADLIEYQD